MSKYNQSWKSENNGENILHKWALRTLFPTIIYCSIIIIIIVIIVTNIIIIYVLNNVNMIKVEDMNGMEE